MTRHIRTHRALEPEPIAVDIRLMQFMTRFLMSVFGLMVLVGMIWGLVRLPLFSITAMTLTGEVEHNNVLTIRANVTPRKVNIKELQAELKKQDCIIDETDIGN